METNDWWNTYQQSDAAEKKSFERLPDGKYVATISGAVVDTAAVPNVLKWEYTIIDGPMKNRKVWSNQRMNPEGMPFIKADMRALGFEEFTSPHAFYEALEQCVGKIVDIFVKNKASKNDPSKIYTNAFLNGLTQDSTLQADGDLINSPENFDAPLFDSSEEISF